MVILANEHVSSGLATFTLLLIEQPKQLGCDAETGEYLCQVVLPDHQVEVCLCVDLDWRILNHELPSEI